MGGYIFWETLLKIAGLNRLEEGGWPKNPLLALRVFLQIAEIDISSSEIRM